MADLGDVQYMANLLKMSIDLPKDYFVDIILIVLYVLFIFTAIAYLEKVARRLSCTSKGGDNLLGYALVALPVFILPTIVK